MTIREFTDAAKAEIETIMTAPFVDPEAPAGFLRPAWVEAETRRRHAEALAVVHGIIARLEQAGGPSAGHAAREHFAPVVAMLGGRGLH